MSGYVYRGAGPFDAATIIDAYGFAWEAPPAGMLAPVRCNRCGHIHDAGQVTVTARYADCSVWNCPGCGTRVDDRTWGGGVRKWDRQHGGWK